MSFRGARSLAERRTIRIDITRINLGAMIGDVLAARVTCRFRLEVELGDRSRVTSTR
jgi:hypothetical protein